LQKKGSNNNEFKQGRLMLSEWKGTLGSGGWKFYKRKINLNILEMKFGEKVEI
jgi:hypothetical protein